MIAFVEYKTADLDAVTRLLDASAARNRWTNFGPVWETLKAEIETTLALAETRCADAGVVSSRLEVVHGPKTGGHEGRPYFHS